jgi:hypothetical protein
VGRYNKAYTSEEELPTVAKLQKPSIPKEPAECADLLYVTREKRLALQRKIEEYELLESTLKDFFINTVSKKSTGVAGRVARIQLENKTIPTVTDWPKLYAHIRKTGNWELLQKRVSEGAVTERWDSDHEVPGVGRFNVVKVSCTAVRKNVKGLGGKK